MARYRSILLTSNGKDAKAAQSYTDGSFVSERRSGNKVLQTAFGRTFCLQINRSGSYSIVLPQGGVQSFSSEIFHGSSPRLILYC